MPAEREERERYRLGERERRGLLAGWRGGQIASVATGLVLAVAAVRVVPGAGGMLLALVLTLAGIACACWPVRGRTLDEWVPALLRHAVLSATGARRWHDRAPADGHLAGADTSDRPLSAGSATRTGPRAGGSFAAISVESAPLGAGGDPIGLVRDREARAWTAVLAVEGGGFALLGAGERRERVAAWSRLLASLARDGSRLHRLQWVERCVPDDAAGVRGHFAASRAVGASGDARRSYEELLDLAAGDAMRHELYVAVTVREPRVTRSGRGAGGDAAVAALAEEAGALERSLRLAGTRVHGALGPRPLASVLGGAFEARPAPPMIAAAQERRVPSWPPPHQVDWDRLRVCETLHASYWIAEWPRSDVGDDFLVPLLTSGAARRTLSVTLAPVAPLRASRDAEHARTSRVADAELRRRHGFAVTARQRRDHDAVAQREVELAAGHASYRFSGYVTVTASEPAELARSCEAVERLAASCQLELRRLYGAQDAGFLACLPIGRGLA